MQWSEVRQAYPDQWLVIEALEAHTAQNQRRLDRLAVVELCADGQAALQSYRRLHQQYPQREFYFGPHPWPLSQKERGVAALSPLPQGEG